jgi:glycine cleavage system H protein
VADQSWYGCVVPDDLLYDVERNVWVRLEGDEAVVGMTDVGQTLCGRFVQVTWKPVGRVVVRGRSLAIIESAKWVGPFPAPLTGEIVATNAAAFDEDLAVANRDPYGAGWMVRLRPSSFDAERGELCDGREAFERYKGFVEENAVRCFRCEE